MTFGNSILKLRERLQDMRKADASLITLASDNGRRWTSSALIGLCNSALLETLRLISVYSDSPILKQLSGDLQGAVVYDSLGVPTESGAIATIDCPIGCIGIIELLGSSSDEFIYIRPIEFISRLSNSTLLSRTDRLFTILFNSDTYVREIKLIGYKTGEQITGSWFVNRADYTIADIAEEFFVTGLDDIFLDIAERQARDIEHHWERSAMLDARIKEKLGLFGGTK
jgi:hypothetical protein